MTLRVWILVFIVVLSFGGNPVLAQVSPDQEPTGTAFIGGRVTSSTGQPVAGAVLRTWSYDVMPLPKMARTNADGRFEFPDLPAGRFVLVLWVNPTLSVNYGAKDAGGDATPIDLRAGQRFERADFTTPRPSVVEGVVTDEFGNPAPNVSVSLSRIEFIADKHRLVPLEMGPARVTDDKGRYRIPNVPPGTYYVGGTTGIYIDQNASGGFAPTFFPGTTDPSMATPVGVAVGLELSGVSFALVPAAMGTVSGVMVDSSGAATRGMIILTPGDLGTVTSASMARATTAADGTFTLRNVPPGSYTLQGFGAGPSGGGSVRDAPFGTAAVTVNSDTQEGVRVSVRSGTAMRGRLVFEGGPPPAVAEVRVATQPIEFETNPIVGGGPVASVINADWTFSLGNNFGRRIVRADVRQPGWTIKRITMAGRDVTHDPLDFRKGDVEAVEITLTNNAPTLAGTVVDRNGARVYDYAVILFAADRSRWTFMSQFVQQARANQDGGFKTLGVPPGDYLAVALSSVQGREWQDPVLLQQFESQAQRITLGEGETRTIQLPLIRRAP